MPEWGFVLVIPAAPADVQPLSVPVSKPPLTIAPGGGGLAWTVTERDAECVVEDEVPVIVTL